MYEDILKEFEEGRNGTPIFWIDKHFYIEYWVTDDRFYLNCLLEDYKKELNKFTVMPPRVVRAWVFGKKGE